MTDDTRIDPPLIADERTMLEGWLDFHRETLALKGAGLSPEQWRTASAPPSGMTLLGLVRHMAEVERAWFRVRLTGEDLPTLYCKEEDVDADFHLPSDADPAQALAAWRAEVARAREAAAARSLDDTFVHRELRFSLRWVYVHMIEEYARHNGHADLVREAIDGVTGV